MKHLRFIGCVAIFLSLLPPYLVSQTPESSKTPHKPKSPTETKKAVTQTTAPAQSGPDAANKPSSNPANTENPVTVISVPPVAVAKDWTDYLTLFLTAVIAVTAIFGTCYALRTLRVLEHEARIAVAALRQTTKFARAADKNARAAKQSADAIANVERAWVMVNIEWEPSSAMRLTRINGGEGKKTGVAIRMICTNEGRMPAWITYRAVHVEVSRVPTGQTVFLPSESSENYIPLAAKGKDDSPWHSFGDGQPVVGEEVFIYGVVRYRDVFGPERETWFGYRAFDDGQLIRIPQREYNRHT